MQDLYIGSMTIELHEVGKLSKLLMHNFIIICMISVNNDNTHAYTVIYSMISY